MTMTDRTRPTKPTRSEPLTYSTTEVIEMTGLSFRVLDYWLRTGAVVLVDGNTPGSGGRRRFTEDEVEAIQRLVIRYRAALADLDEIRSGEAWMQARVNA